MRLKAGIVGCGVISAAYLRGAERSSLFDIVAVADLDSAAAVDRAEEFGVSAKTVGDLLNDPGIDLCINLTVPNAHAQVSTAILDNGKHLYSEKPFATTLEDATALQQLGHSKGLRMGCAPDTFLGAAHQAAREALDSGIIGDVFSVALSVQSRGMEAWHPNPDFFFKQGGGPVFDLGPYYITDLINLCGPVARVMATGASCLPARTIGSGSRQGEQITVETETSVSALLELRSGVRATLECSWDVWSHHRIPIEIYGSEGTMRIPDPVFFGDAPTVSVRGGDWKAVSIDQRPWSAANRKLRSGREAADYRGAGLDDLAAAILEGRPHLTGADLGLHVVEVLSSILRASRTGQPIDILSTCDRPAPLEIRPEFGGRK